jgi:hypothetical protein
MKTRSSTSGSGTPPSPPAWAIDIAANMAADLAADVVSSETEPALIEAQLADHYRDEGVVPLAPRIFTMITSGMDDADWRRFAIVAGMFARKELRMVLPAVSERMAVRDQIHHGMVAPAKALRALEPRILATHMVRAEELARRVADGLGVAFAGETAAQSAARLAKIDYTGLLAKVDKAKASAEEQMAELLKRQEEEDVRVGRQQRGKY